MKSIKNYLLPLIITVILSFLFWIWTSHSWTDYINVLFYVSLISFILLFIILLVQEGIFDVTSYGFRRLTYQLSSNSKKKSMKDDAFFNPKNAKKEHYMISSWVLPSLCINILLVIVTIIVSFTI